MLIAQAANVRNSKMQVQQTQDYNLFKRLPGNRQIHKNHLAHLQESIEHVNLSEYQPILVNENFEVIDGQHRLDALRVLGLPVFYIKADGLGLKEVQTLNTLSKTWGPVDYAKSYIELGRREYQTYLELKNHYHLPHNVLLNYIYLSQAKHFGRDFKEGQLKVEDLATTKRYLEQLQDVGVYYPGYTKQVFAAAFLMVARHPDYNHDRMVAKMRARAHTMKHFSNVEDNQRQLEAVYNYHMSKDRVRFF